MNEIKNSLKKLIAHNLHTRYSGILCLSDISLSLLDVNGDILLELIPPPDFCSHVCNGGCSKICEDYQKNFDASANGRFICKHGLENIVLPIRVNNEVLGYVAGMQVYSTDHEFKKYLIDIQALQQEKGVELEFIAKAIAGLKTVEMDKIKIHEQLCHHIAKNISLDLSESLNSVSPDVARLSIEKEMLEKKIIDLEAKNMSLVINPHFLFNTLNCIARIAHFENSHTIEELIYCLSDLLRYNLKQEDKLHTLASEIDNIEKYLYIQKVRFKNRLEYSIDVPDELRTQRIPNMIIQPIVENALIHGITPKRDGGKISISAEKRSDRLVIFVADNGNGFPKDFLEKLERDENKSGLGFRSTDKRLKGYYGTDFGLKIEKSDYSGSIVAIHISNQPLGGVNDEQRHFNCGR